MTFLLLLFGEILPKVLAQTMPVRFAQFAARPLRVLRWIFYPLSYILVRTSSRISEKAAHKSEISLDELADAVDMTQSSSPEEHVMLSGIVNFVNTEVQEIMKPRVDITALSVTDDYETVKQTIIRSGFAYPGIRRGYRQYPRDALCQGSAPLHQPWQRIRLAAAGAQALFRARA